MNENKSQEEEIPAEVREVLEPAAACAARVGPSFESRLLEEHGSNPRFSFLKEGCAYHDYYKKRVAELQAAANANTEKSNTSHTTPTATSGNQSHTNLASQEKTSEKTGAAAQTQPAEIKPPKKDIFSVDAVTGLSAHEWDLMCTAAQFVAQNGQQCQAVLQQRYISETRFGFLQNNHPHSGIFKRLVEAYTQCILPERGLVEELLACSVDQSRNLERVTQRLQYEKSKRAQEEALKEQKEQKEHEEMFSIDWHQFVVVECIEFGDDGDSNSGNQVDGSVNALDDDELERLAAAQAAVTALDDVVTALDGGGDGSSSDDDVDMEMDMSDEEDDQEVEIRQTYTSAYDRATAAAANAAAGAKLIQCPITGQMVPEDEMAEHLRIQLKDPIAREKMQQIQANERESNLADGADISSYLSRFAKRRTDLFGDDEYEETARKDVEKSERDKKSKVIWDGHSSSIERTAMEAMAGTDLQQHMAEVQQKQAAQAATAPQTAAAAQAAAQAAKGNGQIDPAQAFAAALAAAKQHEKETGNQGGVQIPPPPPPSSTDDSEIKEKAAALVGDTSDAQALAAMEAAMGLVTRLAAQDPSKATSAAGVESGSASGSGLLGQVRSASGEAHPDAPEGKKLRLGGGPNDKLDAKAWAEEHPDPIVVVVQVSDMENSHGWLLNGQTLSVPDVPIMEKVKDLKKRISSLLGGMPPNKQKLRHEESGFLKDNFTLAKYNFVSPLQLSLIAKTRGGRR